MPTAEQYYTEIAKLRNNVYVAGKKVDRHDHMFEKSMSVIRRTFNAVDDPELQPLVVAQSEVDGSEINRFTNTHGSIQDLLNEQEMTRKLCWKSGNCIQRCMGTDVLTAVRVVSRKIDEAKVTEYHKNFLKFLKHFLENDPVGNAGQTDIKVNGSKRSHEQKDPSPYLRMVEKRSDGIAVRGAKAHNTTGPYAEKIKVLPRRALTNEEGIIGRSPSPFQGTRNG